MKNIGQSLGLDKLLVDEGVHFFLSLIIGFVLMIVFSSPWLIAFSLLMGFLIDFDHIVDYLYYFSKNRLFVKKKLWFDPIFHLKSFLSPKAYVVKNQKVFVPFHGWELVPLFWLLLRSWGNRLGIAGLEWTSLAYLAHLSWDQLVCAGNRHSYFFIYRFFNRFSFQAYQMKK